DVAIVTDALTALDSRWLPADSAETSQIQVAADRAEAMAFAVAAATEGDVVVIAGSRTPTGFTFGENEVTDSDIARELLYGLTRPALRLVALAKSDLRLYNSSNTPLPANLFQLK